MAVLIWDSIWNENVFRWQIHMQSIMICVFICGNAINLNKPEIYSYSSHFIQIFKFTLLIWLLQSWVSNSLILNQSIEKMVRSTFYLKHLKVIGTSECYLIRSFSWSQLWQQIKLHVMIRLNCLFKKKIPPPFELCGLVYLFVRWYKRNGTIPEVWN